MGTIVCQHCNSTIGHIEVEKVTTFYSSSNQCDCKHVDTERVVEVK
ncbi:GapA-binding peptide SR1P [Metabacillus herbersteinensis]|uniref:GapA-binding peptide SR1P n=1 Tax=Metabacillus herbersteinensis TaxID=283816 RepID=A0ABV6GLU6_9BACI